MWRRNYVVDHHYFTVLHVKPFRHQFSLFYKFSFSISTPSYSSAETNKFSHWSIEIIARDECVRSRLPYLSLIRRWSGTVDYKKIVTYVLLNCREQQSRLRVELYYFMSWSIFLFIKWLLKARKFDLFGLENCRLLLSKLVYRLYRLHHIDCNSDTVSILHCRPMTSAVDR